MSVHVFCFSVRCPTCGTVVEWNKKSLFRPFCRKRCQLIDFGKWIGNSSNLKGERAMLKQNTSKYIFLTRRNVPV